VTVERGEPNSLGITASNASTVSARREIIWKEAVMTYPCIRQEGQKIAGSPAGVQTECLRK
jgi:hypothetical protein